MSTNVVPIGRKSAQTVELTKAAKQKARRAIENIHLAYFGKEGIRETEEKLAEQRGAAARNIFELAKYASEQCRTRSDAIVLFKDMCLDAEAHYKTEHNVENLKDALPTWAVIKSNILRGVRQFELDPGKFQSEGAFRLAMQKKQQQLAPPVPGRVLSIVELDKMLESTVQLSGVRVLLAQIAFACESLKKSTASKAETILRNTADSLAPLVDQRKIQ
jgi:hypothetical protein